LPIHRFANVYLVSQKSYFMESCDVRNRAYKNGKTFEECRDIARSVAGDLEKKIESRGKVMWAEILDIVEHDELVYKLTLKFLRQDGYNIGNYKVPEVKATA